MKNIIIIYHADCPDGFGGAWSAWKKFGDKADYFPVGYGESIMPGLENKEIYFIDFMYDQYDEKGIQDLIRRNKRVTAIDHHVSKEKLIKLTQDYSYAVDHSGSVLAWKYFHEDKPVPLLLKYVEGQDLWRFDLPDTAAVVTYINCLGYDFAIWDKLVEDVEDGEKRKKFIEKGEFMVSYKEEMLKKIVEENEKIVEFEGHKVYVVNAPHEFASGIGYILYKKRPPFAVTWIEDKHGVHVSLRSDVSVDVAKIAEKYGGGGHKAAAGFSLPSI